MPRGESIITPSTTPSNEPSNLPSRASAMTQQKRADRCRPFDLAQALPVASRCFVCRSRSDQRNARNKFPARLRAPQLPDRNRPPQRGLAIVWIRRVAFSIAFSSKVCPGFNHFGNLGISGQIAHGEVRSENPLDLARLMRIARCHNQLLHV